MVNSRFFIENSQVVVFWILLSIIGLVVLHFAFEFQEKKSKERRIKKFKEANRRQAIIRDANLWRKQKSEAEIKEFRKNFRKQYTSYIIPFEI